MKIIIPMAGTGNRFIKEGYIDPKPLIKLNDKRIIEYILDMFSNDDEIIFICSHFRFPNCIHSTSYGRWFWILCLL